MNRHLIALLGLIITIAIERASAHSRWICPKPRSDNSGIKVGSCGNDGSITDTSLQTTIAPGLFTVYFQETIVHRGAPWRVALSRPGVDDFETCILLDHIPHDDSGKVNQIHGVTINIPDFACDNCALQVIQFMTDKVSGQCTFNPADTTSFSNGQCGSNYFSCANVKITGSKPFDASQCIQPNGFARGYLYKSNEAAAWRGLYLKDYGDPQARTPVAGLCSVSQDPELNGGIPNGTDPDSGSPSSDSTGTIVGVGVFLGLSSGLALFMVNRRRRSSQETQVPITVNDGNAYNAPAKPAKPKSLPRDEEEGGIAMKTVQHSRSESPPYAEWIEPAYARAAATSSPHPPPPKLPEL